MIADSLELVLPRPRTVEKRKGSFSLAGGQELTVCGLGVKRLEATVGLLGLEGLTVVSKPAGGNFPSLSIGKPQGIGETLTALEKSIENVSDAKTREQAYALAVTEEGVFAAAGGEAGLFYAAVTLSHLVQGGAAPCCLILDRPALPRRCALLDVSRGRVPTLSSLKELTDLLSALKFNQLTFNLEHTFVCDKHPAIGEGHDPIAPAEMKELAEYAAARFVEVIPFQQSFGHMRGIVSLPEYKRLAFDEELLWSIDPANDDAYALLADLYDAQIEVTQSSYFHVGCDEPFDIMKRFDPARFAGRDLGAVVRDHLIRLHSMVNERGKTMMAWADAVVSHPEILTDLPDDLVLCHWLYGDGTLQGPEHYRPGLEKIAERGLPFYACTSTWSLMKLFPDLEVMRANHDAFVPEARKQGAAGAMVTLWGDMGHMNLAGLETYSLAYSASSFWEDNPGPDRDLGRAFSWTVHRDPDGRASELAATLNNVNRVLKGPAGMAGVGFMLLFSEPFSIGLIGLTVHDLSAAASLLRADIKRARDLMASMEADSIARRGLWLDSHLAALQVEMLARKIEIVDALKKGWDGPDRAELLDRIATKCVDTAGLASGILALLESRWLTNNKESDLEANRRRYRRLIRAWNERAAELESYARKAASGEKLPNLDKILTIPPGGYVFDPIAEMGLAGLL